MCFILWSAVNSFQKPHCISRTLHDPLCLELVQPSATAKAIILSARDEHLGQPLAQYHKQLPTTTTKKCQMPSAAQDLHWLLVAENKPSSGKEMLWSFSSLKINKTSCVWFFHNFCKTLWFASLLPLCKIWDIVSVPEKLGNIKGALELHVLQLE